MAGVDAAVRRVLRAGLRRKRGGALITGRRREPLEVVATAHPNIESLLTVERYRQREAPILQHRRAHHVFDWIQGDKPFWWVECDQLPLRAHYRLHWLTAGRTHRHGQYAGRGRKRSTDL